MSVNVAVMQFITGVYESSLVGRGNKDGRALVLRFNNGSGGDF